MIDTPAQSKRGLEGEWGGPEDLEREREAEKDGESGKHGDAHTHFATGILATEFSLSTGILSRRTNLSSILCLLNISYLKIMEILILIWKQNAILGLV